MRHAHIAIGGLAIFAVGASGGAYFGYNAGTSMSAMGQFAEVAHYAAYLDTQRLKADDAGYEEALRGFLQILEQRKGRPSLFQSADTIIAIDSVLIHARLSALALKRGASEEAASHMSKAVSLCPQLKWQTCSSEEIREFAQRLDKRGLFGMPASK